MILPELFDPLVVEGPRDPHIFKAIFMLGGPASGKSKVAKEIAAGTGLRYINLDDFFEMFAKKLGKDQSQLLIDRPDLLKQAGVLAGKKQTLHAQSRLGLVIDGTGRKLNRIITTKNILDALGYDTMAVFVNTEISVAMRRNAKRQRKVDVPFLQQAHAEVRANLGEIQRSFDQFLIIDNNEDDNVGLGDEWKKINRFINAPISFQAKQWVKSNL